jgi:hypothetical protein
MSKKQNNATNQFPHRKAEPDATPKSGRLKKALNRGPHAEVVNADGSTQADPHEHPPTSGGNGGKNDLDGLN